MYVSTETIEYLVNKRYLNLLLVLLQFKVWIRSNKLLRPDKPKEESHQDIIEEQILKSKVKGEGMQKGKIL
jgi:hypothetical protein